MGRSRQTLSDCRHRLGCPRNPRYTRIVTGGQQVVQQSFTISLIYPARIRPHVKNKALAPLSASSLLHGGYGRLAGAQTSKLSIRT